MRQNLTASGIEVAVRLPGRQKLSAIFSRDGSFRTANGISTPVLVRRMQTRTVARLFVSRSKNGRYPLDLLQQIRRFLMNCSMNNSWGSGSCPFSCRAFLSEPWSKKAPKLQMPRFSLPNNIPTSDDVRNSQNCPAVEILRVPGEICSGLVDHGQSFGDADPGAGEDARAQPFILGRRLPSHVATNVRNRPMQVIRNKLRLLFPAVAIFIIDACTGRIPRRSACLGLEPASSGFLYAHLHRASPAFRMGAFQIVKLVRFGL